MRMCVRVHVGTLLQGDARSTDAAYARISMLSTAYLWRAISRKAKPYPCFKSAAWSTLPILAQYNARNAIAIILVVASREYKGINFVGEFRDYIPVFPTNHKYVICFDVHALTMHMFGCENSDPFLGALDIRCRIVIGIQKGP